MKDVVVNHIMNNVIKYKNFDEIKLKEIKYGLESFYLAISKTVVIFLIAYFFNLLKTLLLFMCFYGFLRLNGAGLHAKKSWQCWTGSIIVFLIIPYLCLQLNIDQIVQVFISLVCLSLILKYAPADTEKKPIINFKKRLIHKILCCITVFAYVLLLFFLQNNYLHNIILCSIILETIMILPISYKIFGLKYNNYKNYL